MTAFEELCEVAKQRGVHVELTAIHAVYGDHGRLEQGGRLDKLRVMSDAKTCLGSADVLVSDKGCNTAARSLLNRLKLTT